MILISHRISHLCVKEYSSLTPNQIIRSPLPNRGCWVQVEKCKFTPIVCHLILKTIKRMMGLKYFCHDIIKNGELKCVWIEFELLLSCERLNTFVMLLQSDLTKKDG